MMLKMLNREAYTPDAICRAMGLEAFVPSTSIETLRVLLKPSFHPEGCITVQSDALQVHFLTRQLWLEQYPCRIPELSETVLIPQREFQAVVELFHQAHLEHLQNPPALWLDGMPIDAVLRDGSAPTQFSRHPDGNAPKAFVHALVNLARSSIQLSELQKKLDECDNYVE
jgi:hypothetical protein